MREIKFRAWDKKNKQMLAPASEIGNLMFSEGANYDHITKYDAEIMQFTGLKDKNGKEIYEGDIVRHRPMTKAEDRFLYGLDMVVNPNDPIVVKWKFTGFVPFSGWVEKAHSDLEWEVIGNIYENPDLIK